MMLCNASDAISEKSFAKCTRLFLITLILLVCCYAHGAERLKLLSPSGKIAVEFMLTEGEARYRVLLDEIEVIKPSALGFEFKQQPSLFDNLKITDHETDKVRQTWKPVWGNFSSINNHTCIYYVCKYLI